jgi:TPR repeat protein
MSQVPGSFGPYSIRELLGRGGMGEVYRATDTLGRDVALKLLKGASPERFTREAELVASLRHPHIVGVHSAGVVGTTPYIAFELVDGARSFEEASASWDRATRCRALIDVGRALGHAHNQGIVHRDVKPENILVDAAGRVLVSDFGVAHARHLERLTNPGAMVGTPSFMSPEQFQASDTVGPTADVWGLGVLLYHNLTDELPFDGSNLVQLATRIARGDPTPPRELDASLPTALEAVCLRALAPDPGHRFPDGAAFADALQAALEDPDLARRWPRRAALALALALVAGGAALALRSDPSFTAPSAPALKSTAPPTRPRIDSPQGPPVDLHAQLRERMAHEDVQQLLESDSMLRTAEKRAQAGKPTDWLTFELLLRTVHPQTPALRAAADSWLELAALERETDALHRWGLVLFRRSDRRADSFLLQAVARDYLPALADWGRVLFERGQEPEALTFLRKAAPSSPSAAYLLADLAFHHKTLADRGPQLAEAERNLKLAARQNLSARVAQARRVASFAVEVEQRRTAMAALEALSAQPRARFYLGLYMVRGQWGPRDYRRGGQILADLVRAPKPPTTAALWLARLKERGLGGPRDLPQALRLTHYAVQAGNGEARCQEARLLQLPGPDSDPERGLNLLRECGRDGIAEALWRLALRILAGEDPGERPQALALLERAVCGGEPRANLDLAGLVAEENPRRAKALATRGLVRLGRLARVGDLEAVLVLARETHRGRWAAPDPACAQRVLQPLAKAGDRKAQELARELTQRH